MFDCPYPSLSILQMHFIGFANQGERGAQILLVPELVDFVMSSVGKVALFHFSALLFTFLGRHHL